MVWDYQLLNLSTIDLDLVLDTPCYIFIHSCFILKVKGSAEIGSPYYRLWYIQDFLKTKRYSSNTTFKTAFTWLHRTFQKYIGDKKVPFLSKLRWCSFRQLIGGKRPKRLESSMRTSFTALEERAWVQFLLELLSFTLLLRRKYAGWYENQIPTATSHIIPKVLEKYVFWVSQFSWILYTRV